VLVVLNDKQVNQVVDDLLRHPGKIHTIIVSSTVAPGTVILLAEKARAIGIDVIDAPVSGGAEKSSRGIITVLVGGEDRPVERCWPILEAFGKCVFHLGPVGAGSVVKLANNLLSLGGNMLVLEAMELARAYGVTEEAVTDVISTGTGDSRIIRTYTLAGTPALYEAFSKDVKLAAQAAGERGVTLSIAAFLGAMMGEKMKARDTFVESHGMTGPLPQCRICGSELASPFRKAGVHPECAYDEIQEAAAKAR
jgi:3-hydroxyisobutyrate dehydrogenase